MNKQQTYMMQGLLDPHGGCWETKFHSWGQFFFPLNVKANEAGSPTFA